MEWHEEGVVLGVRRHGEQGAIVELLTRGRGRHLGLVRGGRSRGSRPVLQPGNSVAATWRARLEDHLGHYTLDAVTLRVAGLIDHRQRLAGLASLTSLARLLPEREPHPRLYDAALLVLAALDDDALWPALLVRWELGLLDELGFGLDLARCAATGVNENLVYVSPRTGRAVSRDAGEPWHGRLLPLPGFLRGELAEPPSARDLADALRLTGHFLERHVFGPRGQAEPESRRLLTAWFEARTA